MRLRRRRRKERKEKRKKERKAVMSKYAKIGIKLSPIKPYFGTETKHPFEKLFLCRICGSHRGG
jgi:hypothetical protein